MKKQMMGIWTLMMILSLVLLPGGMTAKAAKDNEQVNYCIYFDAVNGKLYKESGFDPNSSSNTAELWEPELSKEYTDVSSITCNGNELTLHNFYLFPTKIAIIIKGDAVIRLSGENVIDKGNLNSARCGIYAFDNLSITGTGSLNIDAFWTGIYTEGSLTVKDAVVNTRSAYYAVHAKKDFVMESGSVTGQYASYYGDNNGGHKLHSIYGIRADDNIVVKGGMLTGGVSGGTPAYGVSAGGNITVNAGILSGTAVPSQGAVPGVGYAIAADGTITMNGGTLAGTSRNADNVSFYSYGIYAEQGIILTNNAEIIGGYKQENIHSDVQLAENKKYFEDKQADKNCRHIRITTKVTGIGSTSPSNPSLVIGGSTELDVTVIPDNASDSTVKWESSDDTVASVDENGKVTGHKPGTVTITATTEDGGHKKEFTVTVSKKDGASAPTGITAVPPTTLGGSDGKLVGVDATMEYSTNKDFTDAKSCTGNEVTGLPAGTYYVRVKETDTTKASAATAVTVPNGGNSGGGTGSGDPKTDQAVADGLGVSTDTAKQIIDEASKLGVSTDTLLITDTSIKNQKSDADLKGSTFGMLKARTSNLKKNLVTVKWDKVKNADGYILYGNKCGKKNTFKHIKTFTKNSTVKYTQKKLKKGTYYKYLVVAYKNINGVKVTIAASKNVHATTKGGRFGVAKSVKVNKTSKTLAVKKKFKIKASEVKLDKKIKHHRNIKFESDNSRVATVNSKGVVTAKQKGRCYIYVYAQNGVYKRIRITVK